MRSLQLLGAAAEAEGLRLRREARALVRASVFRGAAAVFGIAALILLHIAAWLKLAAMQDAIIASVLLALGDLVVMAGLLFAGRRRYDPIAASAKMIRDRSLAEAGRAPMRFASGLVMDTVIRTLFRR